MKSYVLSNTKYCITNNKGNRIFFCFLSFFHSFIHSFIAFLRPPAHLVDHRNASNNNNNTTFIVCYKQSKYKLEMIFKLFHLILLFI